MPSLASYRTLHNLPPLAGIASFEEAAGPGLGVQECVDQLKRFHFITLRAWRLLLSKIPAEPFYEVKMGFSYHAYLFSEMTSAFRARVAEMRHPPLGLDKVPDPALDLLFDELQAAPDLCHLIHGLYQIVLPTFAEHLKSHLAATNPLADAPTVRVINHALADLETIREWGEKTAAAFPAAKNSAWLDSILPWMKGAENSPPRHFSTTGIPYDSTPRRDKRFPDPYNMGVHAEEFLHDEEFANRDKVLMMLYRRLREIDVPEMMAGILYEMAVGEKKQPWGFFQDMTRQLWDEARHAMMGEVGFARLGIDWPALVRVNFTWSKGLNEQLTPRERHAVLWFIEQGQMGKTGKRYEWEVGRDAGDEFAELIQDYDWADEVLHARIGRDWYVKDFENVEKAAEYGSACWDKVVSGWEEWKKAGLTDHHNWWPDLYREACRLRNETPGPETLAFKTSYAETRADLKRIAAGSG